MVKISYNFFCKMLNVCMCGILLIQLCLISGAFGRDFSLAPENICDNIDTVAKGLLAHGVTSFCPTIVTSTPDLYIQVSLSRLK